MALSLASQCRAPRAAARRSRSPLNRSRQIRGPRGRYGTSARPSSLQRGLSRWNLRRRRWHQSGGDLGRPSSQVHHCPPPGPSPLPMPVSHPDAGRPADLSYHAWPWSRPDSSRAEALVGPAGFRRRRTTDRTALLVPGGAEEFHPERHLRVTTGAAQVRSLKRWYDPSHPQDRRLPTLRFHCRTTLARMSPLAHAPGWQYHPPGLGSQGGGRHE